MSDNRMFGYTGKLLRVNLTDGTLTEERAVEIGVMWLKENPSRLYRV